MTILIAIATLLLCAVNPRPYRPTNIELGGQNPGTQQETEHSAQQQTNEPSLTGAISATKKTPIAKAETGESYCVSTETLYRWYMWATIAGAIGTIVGIFVLVRQSILIRRSTQATERSVKLQENTQRQWIDLRDWTVFRIDATKPLEVQFKIANPTNLPLTQHGVIVSVDGRRIDEDAPILLITPADPSLHGIGITLTQEQEKLYDKTVLPFSFEVTVLFADSHNIHWAQQIHCKLMCGRGMTKPIYTVTGNRLYESGVPGERGARNVELP